MSTPWPLIVLLLAGEATAPEPAPETPAPADEEIFVYDEAVKRAWGEVQQDLRDLGYERKRSRDGREIYANEVGWKPTVIIDEDGWMRVKRAPVTLGKPELSGIWRGPLGYLVCVVQPTACVHIQGQIVSGRKLAPQKLKVTRQLDPALDQYREAISKQAMFRWTDQDLPQALDDLWQAGVSIGGDTPGVFSQGAERRQALADFWTSRLNNEWGAGSRRVARAFMEYEVQQGPFPFTAAEIEAINQRRSWGEPLALPLPSGDPLP